MSLSNSATVGPVSLPSVPTMQSFKLYEVGPVAMHVGWQGGVVVDHLGASRRPGSNRVLPSTGLLSNSVIANVAHHNRRLKAPDTLHAFSITASQPKSWHTSRYVDGNLSLKSTFSMNLTSRGWPPGPGPPKPTASNNHHARRQACPYCEVGQGPWGEHN